MLTKLSQSDLSAAQAPATASLRQRIAADVTAADHRAEALWKLAPWMAALSVACAVVVMLNLRDSVPLLGLAAWTSLIVLANIVIVRARKRATGYGRMTLLRSPYWTVYEAAMHAGLWSALPLVAFSGQAADSQILLVGAMATMMAGAFLLVLVPIAATLWTIVIAAALVWSLHDNEAIALPILMLMAGYVIVMLTGCLTVERLLSRHMIEAAEETARRESIALLLREYEEQGAGWLWQIDAANLISYISPRICELLGRSTAQVIGQSLPVILGCDARLGNALVARQPFSGLELEVATATGPCVILLSASPIIAADGTFHGFRGVGSDITEMRRSQDRLSHMARVDVLTGLPNRQHMREIFTEAVTQAVESGRPCALMFLDLDGFKPVNDTFGHPIGDAVLRTVAERLSLEVGDRGRIGRVGGDEFALVLTDGHSRQAVEEMGLRLIRAIARPFPLANGEIRIGLSVGSALAPIDATVVDDLLVKADLALYEAKSRGRGAFVHFEPRLQDDADDRVRLELDLREALKRNEFALAYQPIVSGTTQAIVGFEALLRWNHPQRGAVPPSVFVPIAEENGLIADIGEWVMHRACRDAANWPDSIYVSVNLSARQLVIPALPNVVSEALAAARLQPGRLELEVTESVFMGDGDGSLDVLRRVRSIGVGIALDDFGTGYSSLGYLNKTVFHSLKIDGSFVKDAGRRSETVSIIRAIVTLANSFRMTITAEGVESITDFERMRDLGCHKMQGYLFGRPVPFEETLALVAASRRETRRLAG